MDDGNDPRRDNHIAGCTIGILAVDGFEQAELAEPREALQRAGAITRIVSKKPGRIQGYHHHDKADCFDVDKTFDEVDANEFDALLLPGGALNADEIRMIPGAQKIVQAAQQAGKPIAVICHGPWLLISSGLARGRTLTSWPTLQDDLRNAGAQWIDQEVVIDGNLVSSRKPDDIPAFNKAFLDVLNTHVEGNVSGKQDEVRMGMAG